MDHRCFLTSAVNVLTMADFQNQNQQPLVVNFIHDPMLADANPPQVIAPVHLHYAGRTRVRGQRVDAPFESGRDIMGKPFQRLGGGGLWKGRSAGTDKGMALQIANKRQTDSMLRREGIIDAAMDRFAAAERKLLAEHLAEFEADILARNGKEAYAFQVQQRAERIVMLGEVERLSQLKPAALNAAIAKLRDKAHKKASLAHHIRAAKRFRACYEL